MKTVKGIIWFEDNYIVDHRGKHGLLTCELYGEGLAKGTSQIDVPFDTDDLRPRLRSVLREVELKLTPKDQDLKVSRVGKQIGDLVWKARKAVDCPDVRPTEQKIVRDLCDAIALLNERMGRK